MQIMFDIADDELQVFMPEAEEQLQKLEDGLMRLERSGADDDLLQVIFRAAHTLKGAAGAIGHIRMSELTHAMETVLDGLRKGQHATTPAMMDALLGGLDALRLLLEEVVTHEVTDVDHRALVDALEVVTRAESVPAEVAAAAGPTSELAPAQPVSGSAVQVVVDIDPASVASAARALQIMITLQGLGALNSHEPPAADIEAAKPCRRFVGQLETTRTAADIEQALTWVSDVSRVTVLAAGQPLPAATTEPVAVVPEPTPVKVKPAEPAAQTSRGGAMAPKPAAGEQTIRTTIERVNTLMNLTGELITDRNRLAQIRSSIEPKLRGDSLFEDLVQTTQHLARITDQLQEEVMRIRMLPISTAFNKFPRLVRDLAKATGKQIDLQMRGEDTELDRTVIEAISDPLIHLVRNSVDHGLETPDERRAAGKTTTGTVLLTARHEEGRIIVTVEDDGRGINVDAVKASAVRKGRLTEAEAAALSNDEAINLIFESGLSTARNVSNISGRGVGMDIVRSNIERLNGSIAIDTKPGHGTVFSVSLPLTLAIVPALLVKVSDNTMAVPLPSVVEALRVPKEQIKKVNGRPVMRLRERVLPIVYLGEVLAFNGGHRKQRAQEYVVAVRWGKLEMGLAVDRLIGEQELVIKTISPLIGDTPGTAGAAILGDGRVALIADVPGLFRLGGA